MTAIPPDGDRQPRAWPSSTHWPASPTPSRRPSPASCSRTPTSQAAPVSRTLCKEAGLTVREDPIGNIFARWDGSATRPARRRHRLAHRRDSVLRPVRRHRRRPRRAGGDPRAAARRVSAASGRSSCLMFTSEEPTRFGIGCLGSRAACRGIDWPRRWPALRDAEGRALDEVRREAGLQRRARGSPAPEGYYAAFVELHIEQGPMLEREELPIGVVTAIAAPAALRRDLEGRGRPRRSGADAGPAGTPCAPRPRSCWRSRRRAGRRRRLDTVATTGVCQVHPGAINSIPSQVTLEIDIRDTDLRPPRPGRRARSAAAIDADHRGGAGLRRRSTC